MQIVAIHEPVSTLTAYKQTNQIQSLSIILDLAEEFIFTVGDHTSQLTLLPSLAANEGEH